MRSALTRSRASPETELSYLTFYGLETVKENPDEPSHAVVGKFEKQWIACVPV